MSTKELVFELIGVDRASHTFEKVTAAVETQSKSMGRLQKTGAIAGKALLVGFAGVAAGGYMASKAAAEDQASQAALAKQLGNVTGASHEQIDATDEWIKKQALATGISVEQLRPALQKLATSTGDLGKAQGELSEAMDVSAGSGKSLDMVATALVKVNNGSATGLAKLGVVTKTTAKDTAALQAANVGVKSAQLAYTEAVKAHGAHSAQASIASDKLRIAQQKVGEAQEKTKSTTISASDAMAQLAKKYGGDAAAAAQTNAGKQKVLGVEMHELVIQIGTGLLPVMQKLTEIGLQVVHYTSEHTHEAGLLLVGIGALLTVITAVSLATKVYAAGQAVWAAGTKVVTAGQWLLNAALDANPIGLVIIAIAALVAALVIAYKHSDTFRAIVDKTFTFIGKVVPQVIGTVVGFVKDHWGLLVSIIGGPMGLIVVQVIKHWDTIRGAVSAAVDFVVGEAKGFAKFASQVIDDVGDVVTFFKKLPGKITGFLDDLPGDMKTIGGQIVEGLKQGIEDLAYKVWDAVQSIVDKIPKKIRQIMGISSPSKVTYELGQFIGQGLADGISSKQSAAEAAAQKLTDKMKAKLSTLKDAFKSLKTSVADAFDNKALDSKATDAILDKDTGAVTTPAMSASQNYLASLSKTSGTLGALKAAFKKLEGWGLTPQFLGGLVQSGNSDLILDLANDQATAMQAASLAGGNASMAAALGGGVAQDTYGDDIADVQDKLHPSKGGKGKGGPAAREEVYELHVHLDVDGKTTQTSLLRLKRLNGGKQLGLA